MCIIKSPHNLKVDCALCAIGFFLCWGLGIATPNRLQELMPELPEVEIVRRGLQDTLSGQTIENIQINRHDLRVPIPQNFASSLRGHRVETLLRRGKYIIGFTNAQNGDEPKAFVLHLGMSGRIKIFTPNQEYIPKNHDHVILTTTKKARIVFYDPRRFGMLYEINPIDWTEQKPFCQMGPEPLEDGFDGPVLQDALQRKRTPIKTALLDQKTVAGVGNIYACEALYQSGIHPERPSHSLSDDEATRLASAVCDVLRKAIDAGGSTLRDYAQTDGSLGYFQHQFNVYDRADHPCPDQDCVGHIQRITQSNRSTFYCPACQK